jgi:hypothetical protein
VIETEVPSDVMEIVTRASSCLASASTMLVPRPGVVIAGRSSDWPTPLSDTASRQLAKRRDALPTTRDYLAHAEQRLLEQEEVVAARNLASLQAVHYHARHGGVSAGTGSASARPTIPISVSKVRDN